MKSRTEKFDAPAKAEIKPAPTTRRLCFGAGFVQDRRQEEGLPE